jgi:hypothetical protein
MPDIEVGHGQNPEEVIEEVDEPEVEAPKNGTILEAAFVDPAYPWPPVDGQGKNAIELQASAKLLDDDDATTDGQREAMKMPKKPASMKKGFFGCCRSSDLDVISDYEQQKAAAVKARGEYKANKKVKDKDKRRVERYKRVPEGILIYRLDTANHTLELVSEPSTDTDMGSLVETMVIASSKPSSDKSRRGIEITGIDGSKTTLVACEQRTAIAWCEAMDMMSANKQRSAAVKSGAKLDGKKVRFWNYL